MRRSLIRFSAFAGLAFAAVSANAIVIIDDFVDGDYNITARNPAFGGPTQLTAIRSGSMITGERDVFLEWLSSGTPPNPAGVNSIVSGGFSASFYSEGSGETGRVTLQYDAAGDEVDGPGPLTNTALATTIDLSADLGFQFFFPFINDGNGGPIQLEVRLYSAAGILAGTSYVGQGTNVLHFVSFGSLAGPGDLTAINRIEFTFTGQAGSDFTLDYIRTAVPGPAALLPFAAGMLGVARRRRNRR